MPKAIVTSRELKNRDSGIDLYVTNYSEQKGLLSSMVHYQVVLVSNLSCFKTPSHKESDIVQYSLEKKLSEFEDLRAALSEMYPNTVLPVINKMSLLVNDAVLRERRNSLDHLMKFIASIPKLAMSIPLLEFLGVDSIRAKKFSLGDNIEATVSSKPEQDIAPANDSNNIDFLVGKNEDQEESDLFKLASEDSQEDLLFGEKKDSNLVVMFEEQDLKRVLTDEDEKDFQFIPDAIIKKKETIKVYEDLAEDHSDLFEIEDNLDEILTVDVGKRKNRANEIESLSTDQEPTTKPATLTKPIPPTKPALPTKPIAAPKDGRTQSIKPSIPAKPTKATPQSSQQSKQEVFSSNAEPEDLNQEDIMKYLQDNLAAASEDVDLFS